MLKKRWWFIWGFLIIVALKLALIFDSQIVQFVSSLRNYYLNIFFLGIKFIDSEIAIVLLLTLILFWKKGKRDWIFPLWAIILATAIVSIALKYFVQRPRPFAQGVISLLPGVADKASYHIWDFSFPSFDTALVFCAVPVVWKFFPRFRYVWIVFASLVGLSRLYIGVHFMSDVIFGGVMGFLIGILVVRGEEKNHLLKKLYRKTIKFKK